MSEWFCFLDGLFGNIGVGVYCFVSMPGWLVIMMVLAHRFHHQSHRVFLKTIGNPHDSIQLQGIKIQSDVRISYATNGNCSCNSIFAIPVEKWIRIFIVIVKLRIEYSRYSLQVQVLVLVLEKGCSDCCMTMERNKKLRLATVTGHKAPVTYHKLDV